jgi:MYXO-CTERM domain-containing protein
MTRHLSRAFVFVLLVIAGVPARASLLPAAVGQSEAASQYPLIPNETIINNFGIPSTASASDPFGGAAFASVSKGGTALFAQANFVAGSSFATSAQANLFYDFEVIGPSSPSTIFVPVNVQANLSAFGGNGTEFGAIANAFLRMQYPFNAVGTQMNASVCSAEFACSNKLAVNQTLFLEVNRPVEVEEGATAFNAAVPASLAMADPFIQIDPSFLADNPGFSLEFSDGIDNVPVSETPLPAALPMFGAALLALGAFAWRRRREA